MNTLLWILMALLALAVLYLWMIAPCRKKMDTAALDGWLYAHRGLHDGNKAVPENSLAAFDAAAQNGYGMELDVQLTKDKKLVVFHDATLKRVCGVDKNVADLTYEELSRIPLPDGTPVPLFREVLSLVNGRAPMIVEVKHYGSPTENARAAHEALLMYEGAYCVESFHPLAVRYFRTHAPAIVRGQLAEGGKWSRNKGILAHIGMKFLLLNLIGRPHFVAYSSASDHNLSMWLMKHAYKPKLAAWTIRSQKALDEAAEHYDYPIFELFTPNR